MAWVTLRKLLVPTLGLTRKAVFLILRVKWYILLGALALDAVFLLYQYMKLRRVTRVFIVTAMPCSMIYKLAKTIRVRVIESLEYVRRWKQAQRQIKSEKRNRCCRGLIRFSMFTAKVACRCTKNVICVLRCITKSLWKLSKAIASSFSATPALEPRNQMGKNSSAQETNCYKKIDWYKVIVTILLVAVLANVTKTRQPDNLAVSDIQRPLYEMREHASDMYQIMWSEMESLLNTTTKKLEDYGQTYKNQYDLLGAGYVKKLGHLHDRIIE